MLLTKIPHFHDVILMSFRCQHCGYENVDVQSAGQIQEKGVRYTLVVNDRRDLDRATMVSDTATFSVKEFEIEKQPSSGQISSVEGMLMKMVQDLNHGQEDRKGDDPETWMKISRVIENIMLVVRGDSPATIILDDPAGNAWLERLPTDTGNKWIRELYERTPEQNTMIGIGVAEDLANNDGAPEAIPDEGLAGIKGLSMTDDGFLYSLQIQCPGCTKPTVLNYHMMDIPHFKQVVISATNCAHCGYRTNDVKTGGEVPDKGQRIWLEVRDPADLRRDILKSETCALRIPECEVEVVPGTMGGRFTTVEGLLTQVRDDLHKTVFNCAPDDEEAADSIPQETKEVWERFFRQLDKAIKGDIKYTVVLEDPFANSYVQNLNSPDPDPQIRIEEYDRTAEEEEELGLADMKTHLGADGEYVREILDVAKRALASTVPKEGKDESKGEELEATGTPESKEPAEAAAKPEGKEHEAAAEHGSKEREVAMEIKGKGTEAPRGPKDEGVSSAEKSYDVGDQGTRMNNEPTKGEEPDATHRPLGYLSRWLDAVTKPRESAEDAH